MKKYLVIAFLAIGSLTTSCTTDTDEISASKTNVATQELNTSMQKDGDNTEESDGDSGGETGNNPIKP